MQMNNTKMQHLI